MQERRDYHKAIVLIPKVENPSKAAFVLIPKVENPSKLTQLQPISLCNVMYKLVTKTIVNWPKYLMGEVVNPNQESFVPRRQITYNIIVCQEIVHSLWKRKGKKKGMVVKLDLEKAYDRSEWRYIAETLENVRLPRLMIDVIMHWYLKWIFHVDVE